METFGGVIIGREQNDMVYSIIDGSRRAGYSLVDAAPARRLRH